jgi:glyoxylase-like metal-dependent hydrolase (beta-lactamase superfamily II)/rhodanese-related sulfurtransferase
MITTLFATGDPDRAYALQLPTPALGDHSYLVVVNGDAACIDPQRDIERLGKQIDAAGVRLVAVLETHVHNDYVSGGPLLAANRGARYLVPADSGVTVAGCQPIANGERVDVGGWRLTARHTPGHTPHHLAYILEGSLGPVAAFTGGSLLVGAVGRTDLLGLEIAEKLAHEQFRSVRGLASALGDPVSVQPTHGAGSFCVSGSASASTSTIGVERITNPALTADDENTWVEAQLVGATLFPSYYAHMAPLNREGTTSLELQKVPWLAPAELAALGDDTWVVDLRSADEFAEAHLPGSLNIPFGDDMAAYVGWVLPWGDPTVLVSGTSDEIDGALLALARIGVENVVGAVPDALVAYRAAELPLASYRIVSFEQMRSENPALVVDARDPVEYREGHLPRAINVHPSRLPAALKSLPPGAPWVHCASGFRAAIAASLLARSGRTPVLVAGDYRGP